VLAGHAGVRPPFELGFPARAYGNDGDLRQPALDRRLEPENAAQRGEVPPNLGRVDKRIERAGQRALVVDQRRPPRADDTVPHLLAGVVQFVAAKIRKAAHGTTIVRAGARQGRTSPRLGASATEHARLGGLHLARPIGRFCKGL
jgi:hypothetical protein